MGNQKKERKFGIENFQINSVVTNIKQDDKGYLYIQTGKGTHYKKLYHMASKDKKKYFMYYRDAYKNIKVIENKKDIDFILNFIKSIEIKEESA